ncbi:N-acetylmuramoyl-L-alanine amidase [Synechococcus elongatus PCC 6311]|nr:N-acetylmuramoyl-L-alanine amidase [Synechococcus elongatus FACHB-242]MBD2689415.1 N-acetylmuramoyl-L-alanine amidase [Synechococcus elongatus FACHB-1061]MBD2708166.1 N-acetylmuramoyl-L-alanine amidase [Synechococcus elongatus PCC 7942 = FACHB-805]UOW71404.1 N-acetylmuramoyl-L-alanine amidase [Synechococcus elongatus PCC 7943]UOW74049.1 N-acetylmuramoyl-L-alanine amidase [Synechococcus elongatus PCC 6311]UOW76770.1 N-acetylmuramoyl-L-alanine amidase [Synechococcus elongatus PCC 6301]
MPILEERSPVSRLVAALLRRRFWQRLACLLLFLGVLLTGVLLHDRQQSQSLVPLPTAIAFQQFFRRPAPELADQTPAFEIAWAHPNNYGERLRFNADGSLVDNEPLIVLHETVYSADSAIDWFRRGDLEDSEAASYHAIIRRNGAVISIVPAQAKAYGAAESGFDTAEGLETLYGDPEQPPSVNSFSYHISLETPLDGQDSDPTHSGYTVAQYRSLAWLIAQTEVPAERITTHKEVDLSGERIDPRSFDRDRLLKQLRQFRDRLATGTST